VKLSFSVESSNSLNICLLLPFLTQDLAIPFPRFSGPTRQAFSEAALWTFAVIPLLNYANGDDYEKKRRSLTIES
jgi:hypothetical protein